MHDDRHDLSVVTLLASRLSGGLEGCLDGVAAALGLEGLALWSVAGELLARDGVPQSHHLTGESADLRVTGADGRVVGRLTATGTALQPPVLRALAAVLALALAPPLARALVQDLEADREQLADSFHDGPVQAMVVARYACDVAVRTGDNVVARTAVQEGLVEARQALWRIRGRGHEGLGEALETLSQKLVDVGGEPLETTGLDDTDGLTLELVVTAYRLAQALAQPDSPPLVVTARRDDRAVTLCFRGGRPLTDTAPFVRRARALGAALRPYDDALMLVAPLSGADSPPTPHREDTPRREDDMTARTP